MTIEENLKYWIWITRIPGVGVKTVKKLIDYYKDPEQIYNADCEMLKQCKLLNKKQIVHILAAHEGRVQQK